jgi:hypothetical protein
MNRAKNKMLQAIKRFSSRSVVGTCTAIAFSLSMPISPILAQSSGQTTLQDIQIIFNDPTPPQQGSPSGRQRGGASRGPCRQFQSLTALVPATKGMVWGQTVSDRPTFWFYIPDPLTTQTPIEFTVQDAADNYIYQTRLTTSVKEPGLIQLSVPATAKPLEVGKPYAWTLSVYCNPDKPSEAVFVKGTVQRVAPNSVLINRLKSAPPLEQVNIYAAEGIWHEALNQLAVLHRANPKNPQITSSWTSFLQQVDLANLATKPFVSCCTAEQGMSDRPR